MTASTSRSLAFSMLLHGCVVAVALLLMLPATREQVVVPPTFIFTNSGPAQSSAPSNPATSGPAVKFPAVRIPVLHQAVPVTETADEPVRTAPVRRVPPPVVRTPPAKLSRAVPQATLRTPQIDIGQVLASASAGPSSATLSAADENLSADYLARLMGKLRAAHEKPDGLDAGLKARVEFSIRADGSLADVRIVESSGSRAFDDSVIAAFLKVRDLGAPPHGPSRGNRVTFRTSDGA